MFIYMLDAQGKAVNVLSSCVYKTVVIAYRE